VRQSKSFNFKVILSFLLFAILFYVGCGGSDDSGQVLPTLTNNDKVASTGDLTKVKVNDMILTDKNEDEYYDRLEKILNGEYSVSSNAPRKAATPYLSNMTLSKKTDEVQTQSPYNLASNITTTAIFSNGATEPVTPSWIIYSGVDSLDGNIYTASVTAGKAVFIARYSVDGVTRFAIFRLTINGISSLSLSKTTDTIQSVGIYDLSSILVYAKSSTGAINNVTADLNTKWALSSGRGTFSGTNYFAPDVPETAVFTASYTEAGAVQSAQFTLKVTGLISLTLSKTTDTMPSSSTYDLTSLTATAKFSDGMTKTVSPSWVPISFGNGTFDGAIYTSPANAETVVFTASYFENGITKTANFTLKVTGLSSLSLNKTTETIQSGTTYDLASLIVTAKFSDGSTKTISPAWVLTSGSGTFNGTTYVSAVAETAVFTTSYTENGITRTVQFKLVIKLQAPTPGISPAAGTYTSAQNITLTSSIPSVIIKYTTNGTIPSATNGDIYSNGNPINIATTTIVKAIIIKSGMIDSALLSATYVINIPMQQVAAPVFSSPNGTYPPPMNITLASSTVDATIKYTIDGSTPTSTNGIAYTGPITISTTTTIKALAIKTGMIDSEVTSATYTIASSQIRPPEIAVKLYGRTGSGMMAQQPAEIYVSIPAGNSYTLEVGEYTMLPPDYMNLGLVWNNWASAPALSYTSRSTINLTNGKAYKIAMNIGLTGVQAMSSDGIHALHIKWLFRVKDTSNNTYSQESVCGISLDFIQPDVMAQVPESAGITVIPPTGSFVDPTVNW